MVGQLEISVHCNKAAYYNSNDMQHTAPFDAMVQVLDGKAEFTIEGKPFQLAAGQMLIMPANKPHAVNAIERFKMLLTMIRS